MGAAVGCCSGKAAEVVTQHSQPLERSSVGVSTGGGTNKNVGSGSCSSEDSGNVSPNPSDIGIGSADSAREDSNHSEPLGNATVDRSSDYESNSGDVTNDYDKASTRDVSHSGDDTNPHSLRKMKRKKRKTPLPANKTLPRITPKQPIPLPNPRNLSSGYVTSIGTKSRSHNNVNHGLNVTRAKDHYAQSEHSDWGKGYRLGGNNSSRIINERQVNLDNKEVVDRSRHSGKGSGWYTLPKAPYRLDTDDRPAAVSSTSAGFVGHRPLKISDKFNHQGSTYEDGPSLSVTGKSLNIHGQSQGSNKRIQCQQKPKQSEAFFLPITPQTAEENQGTRRHKKGGSAFMITFHDEGMSTIPLNHLDNRDTEENANGEKRRQDTMTPDIVYNNLHDYSYNLSRSNSRSTVNSESGSRYVNSNRNYKNCTTQSSVRKYVGPANKKDWHNKSNDKGHQSRTESKETVAVGTNVAKVVSVKHPNGRFGTRGVARHSRVELDALNQHINDLRQLLSLHIRSKGKSESRNMNSAKSKKNSDGDTQPDHIDLIQRLQGEIVSLENKLCEKEDELQHLKQHTAKLDQEDTGNDFGLQVSPETSEMITGMDVQDSGISEIMENHYQVLSEMDKEAAERLQQASKEGVTDGDITKILEDHLTKRDLLRQKMQDEKTRLIEKMNEKLENRHKTQIGKSDSGCAEDNDCKDTSIKYVAESKCNNPNTSETHDTIMLKRNQQDANKPYKGSEHARTNVEGTEELDESVYSGYRIRSNTFTKEDHSRSVNNGKHILIPVNDKPNPGHIPKSGTFVKTKDATNPLCQQDDTHGTEVEPLKCRTKVEVEAREVSSGVSNVQNIGDIQTSIAEILHLADKATKELNDKDTQFIRNTWSQRTELDLTTFQGILTQHLSDKQRLQDLKMIDLNRRKNHLMEKLRERLERNPNRDENVEELFEDIEKAANEVSLEEIKIDPPEVQEVPKSQEELRNLLKQSSKTGLNFLREELRKKELHIKKLQQYILNLEMNKRNGDVSTSVSGTQVGYKTDEQAIQTTSVTTSFDTGIDTIGQPVTQRPRDIQEPDVEEVILEHKQRVHTLRQRKEEDERVHQEKVQERLARRRDQQVIDTTS